MKKRVFFLAFVLVSVLAAVSFIAVSETMSAPWYVEDLSFTNTPQGEVSAYFYVQTGTTGWLTNNDIELEFTKGTLFADFYYKNSSSLEGRWYAYPSVEAKIFRWDNAANMWIREQRYDIYNEPDDTVTDLADNSIYCIQLYFWRAKTTADSYDRQDISKISEPAYHEGVADAKWGTPLPTVTVTEHSQAHILSHNPLQVIPKDIWQ